VPKQAMSIPAILTDVDGMGEVLRLTQSGLLVPVGDAAAFAEAIVRLAGDDALRVSRRALEAYRTRFTVEKMAAGYMELYRGKRGVEFPPSQSPAADGAPNGRTGFRK